MQLIESPLDRALKSSGFGSPESKHSVQGNNRLYTDKTLGGCIEIASGEKPVEEEIDDYITFFNEARPAYALNYLTPKQYRELYAA